MTLHTLAPARNGRRSSSVKLVLALAASTRYNDALGMSEREIADDILEWARVEPGGYIDGVPTMTPWQLREVLAQGGYGITEEALRNFRSAMLGRPARGLTVTLAEMTEMVAVARGEVAA